MPRSARRIVERLLLQLTGAEAATVVNNNAAAILIALNTLAVRRDVIVSRGELIEIGPRLPSARDLGKSGASLKEVGTTNRTHPADYECAIDRNTGLLLKVHTSNYRIAGSRPMSICPHWWNRATSSCAGDGRPGSGALVDLSQYGLPRSRSSPSASRWARMS